MKNYIENYNYWLNNEYFDEKTKIELTKIKENLKEIEERFYKDLEFGTGGLRGIIGAGTNRINIYTIRKASQGLSNYIIKSSNQSIKKGIVVAYDSRFKSYEFALASTEVFCANGILVYLFSELKSVPELSFAIRYLNAAGGIIITASHNPKEYNGYKVYGSDGGQFSLESSNAVLAEILNINDITKINIISENEAKEKGLLKIIGEDIDNKYISRLKSLIINPDLITQEGDKLKIIYTPLHGTGNKPVRKILSEIGIKNVLVVPEQELPDSEFRTVKTPNPEEKDSFKLAMELSKKENADLIIGTDPDCDRIGVVVKSFNDEYIVLTGNQTGCLLLEYILSQKKANNQLPSNGFVVKTIVTTELARTITNFYNIKLIEVLTGFKFIGEKIKELDEFGNEKFLFGFEESFGYLAGTFVRDKDGIVAAMLIAEMTVYYKKMGMSLYDGLLKIYEKYGFFIEDISSFTLKGKDGIEKINTIMSFLRKEKYTNFHSTEIITLRDYLQSKRYDFLSDKEDTLHLPISDVLYYETKDGSWFCIRPSGTEPKIKIYFEVSAQTEELAQTKKNSLKANVLNIFEKLLGNSNG